MKKELTEKRGSRICFVSLGITASAAKFKVVESFPGIKEHVTVKVGGLNSSGKPTQELRRFTCSTFLSYFVLRGVTVMTAILTLLTDWLPSLELFAPVEMTEATLACLLTHVEGDNDVVVVVLLTSSSVMEGC